MSALLNVHVDLSDRAVTNFSVGDIIYRMTPGASSPVTRYFVSEVLGKDLYKVQVFDGDGCLLKQPIVITKDRAKDFFYDPVATKLYDRVKYYEERDEKSI